MTNERSSLITIGGEQYEMILTTRATKAISNRYGGLDNLGDKLMKSENMEMALDEIIWLITLLCNQSIEIYNLRNSEKKPLLTEETVELLTSPGELAEYKDAITEAMLKGTKRNPVKAERIETSAFTMIVTTEKETVRLQSISADFGVGDFGSTIWLAFGSSVMKDSVQSITLLYDGDVGNLTDVLNNAPCNGFQTSFIYTPYEEEQND